MRKLDLFRTIGESLARTGQHDGQAAVFFKTLTEEWYPYNEHRRAWAVSNLELFYTQERERIQIMNKLSNRTTGDAMVAEIRRRQEAAKS